METDHCHPPSGTTTHSSFVQQQAALEKNKCHVRDAGCPYRILRVQIATKQLVKQQSIELIDSAKCRRLRWCGKLSSSKQQQQDSVQVRIVRNYSGTRPPPRRQTNANYETVLVQLPKQMDPSFNFKMRRHIPERG